MTKKRYVEIKGCRCCPYALPLYTLKDIDTSSFDYFKTICTKLSKNNTLHLCEETENGDYPNYCVLACFDDNDKVKP